MNLINAVLDFLRPGRREERGLGALLNQPVVAMSVDLDNENLGYHGPKARDREAMAQMIRPLADEAAYQAILSARIAKAKHQKKRASHLLAERDALRARVTDAGNHDPA